jgi:hypothetical protein
VTAFANAKGGDQTLVVLSAIAGPEATSPVTSQPGCNGGSGSSNNPASTGADAQYDYAALIAATIDITYVPAG